MYYTALAIGLAILGATLLMSPEFLISSTTTNKTLRYIYDNNKLFGAVVIAIACYVYITYVQKSSSSRDDSTLPTYEESEIEYSSKTPSYMNSETASVQSKRSSK